jgi:predicted DsbA family dithiol-disulfide isomerase
MAESGLDSLRETHAVQVEWRAFELRPEEAPPLPAEAEAAYRARIMEGWPRVQQIARERFGLEMRRSEETVRRPTRRAHMGAKFASERGQGEAYHRAVFRAHWQALRDISSSKTLTEIAREIGLPEAGFRAALEDEQFLAAVLEDERWAAEHGLTGVPAFIFGERYLVVGAQPAEALRQVADRCLDEGRVV